VVPTIKKQMDQVVSKKIYLKSTSLKHLLILEINFNIFVLIC